MVKQREHKTFRFTGTRPGRHQRRLRHLDTQALERLRLMRMWGNGSVRLGKKFSDKSLYETAAERKDTDLSAAFPAGPEIAPASRRYYFFTIKQRAVKREGCP